MTINTYQSSNIPTALEARMMIQDCEDRKAVKQRELTHINEVGVFKDFLSNDTVTRACLVRDIKELNIRIEWLKSFIRSTEVVSTQPLTVLQADTPQTLNDYFNQHFPKA